jgi:hypothetical protein
MPTVQDLVDSLKVTRGHSEGDNGRTHTCTGTGTGEMEQVYVTIHGVERRVSHPLTMWGLQRRAGLQLRGENAAEQSSD